MRMNEILISMIRLYRKTELFHLTRKYFFEIMFINSNIDKVLIIINNLCTSNLILLLLSLYITFIQDFFNDILI